MGKHDRVRGTRAWQRRTLLRRLGAAAVAAGLFAGLTALRLRARRAPDRRAAKVVVTPSCVACLGCVAVCPTAAIEIRPGGIGVIQDDCVSCGYCQSGCAVDGIRVVSEHRG